MTIYDPEMQTPCYVISDRGISYEDDWCYGKSEYIGRTADDWQGDLAILKADIRTHWNERNGIPLYKLSDHGNLHRSRSIRLRRMVLRKS